MRDLELSAAHAADHVMAITGALRDWLIEQGLPPEKVTLLPNGCAPSQFKPRTRDRELVDRLALGDAFVVGYIGSIVFYEGIELIVEAVRRARPRMKRDVRFLLVGDGNDYEQAMAAVDAKAREWVVATGRVPHADIRRYYSLIDALVLARPSLPVCEMISPLKPLEAMAMGKLVISSDVAAIKEIMEASGSGRLFRAGDADALADQIVAAAEDPRGSAASAANGREWVIAQRDWKVLAGRALSDVVRRFGMVDADRPRRSASRGR
jgi:glycosyltransferase involved in cell wall biosynthesis